MRILDELAGIIGDAIEGPGFPYFALGVAFIASFLIGLACGGQ